MLPSRGPPYVVIHLRKKIQVQRGNIVQQRQPTLSLRHVPLVHGLDVVATALADLKPVGVHSINHERAQRILVNVATERAPGPGEGPLLVAEEAAEDALAVVVPQSRESWLRAAGGARP